MLSEKERKILEMQPLSTRTALMQSEEERISHRLNPVPKEAQCVKEDNSVDLNVRELTVHEAARYNALRYFRGEWISEMRGESILTLTEEKKTKATNAFMALRTIDMVKDAFKDLMGKIFKPQHAEIVAEEMRKRNET